VFVLTILCLLTLFCPSVYTQAPVVDSITPNAADNESLINVIIKGRNFLPGAKINLLCRELEKPHVVLSPTVKKRVKVLGQYTTYEGEAFTKKVVFHENHLYVVLDRGLWIIDVRERSNPAPLATVPTEDDTWAVYIERNLAYLATCGFGYRIIDVSIPKNPVSVGWDLIPNCINGLAVDGTLAFMIGKGLQIVDLKDPLLPVELGSIANPPYPTDCIYARGLLYISGGMYGGIYSINVSNPNHPTIAGISQNRKQSSALEIEGDYLYATESYNTELSIYSLNEPKNPEFISSFKDEEEIGELCATNGSLFFTSDKGIKVLDVSSPLHPRLIAAYPTIGQAAAVTVSHGYAYVAVGDSGLQVIRLNEQVTDIRLIDSQTIKATFPSRLLAVMTANSTNNIGLVYQAWGQFDRALEYLENALLMMEKLEMGSSMAINLSNIGTIYTSWGLYDRALEYYEECLALMKRLGEEQPISTILINIGGIQEFKGDFDKAITYYEQALRWAEKRGSRNQIALSLLSIASVYRVQKRYTMAMSYTRKALSMAEESGLAGVAASSLNAIGIIYTTTTENTDRPWLSSRNPSCSIVR